MQRIWEEAVICISCGHYALILITLKTIIVQYSHARTALLYVSDLVGR